MAVTVLLLAHDPALISVMKRVCGEANIGLEFATDVPEAEDMLSRRKFDGAIVDCDDVTNAAAVVRRLRKGASNRSAVVFAIRNGSGISVREAFELGANFVLDKPIDLERATRCVRAAHGLLVRERRRYFRVPMEIPVELKLGDGTSVSATIANLSEGGMSIRSKEPLPARTTVKLSFSLPNTNAKIEAKGEVAWSLLEKGRSGIHFIYMPDDAQRDLILWLNSELQNSDPVLLFNAARGWVKAKGASE